MALASIRCVGAIAAAALAEDQEDEVKSEALCKGTGVSKSPVASETKLDFAKDIKPIFLKTSLD